MFKPLAKLHVPKGADFLLNKDFLNYTNIINKQFATEKPRNTASAHQRGHHCKARDAFQGLKSKISADESQENLRKYAMGNSFEDIKHKLYNNFRFRRNSPKKSENTNKFDQANLNAPYESLKTTEIHEETIKTSEEEYSRFESVKVTEVKNENLHTQEAKVSFKESLSSISVKAPLLSKVAGFVVESWEQTFPKDKFDIKVEKARRLAKELAEKEKEHQVEYTEEELVQMQGAIPQWKRTALEEINAESIEDKSLRRKLVNALYDKVSTTETAKAIKQSEQYKEYQEFRKEMNQFKEDFKDHLGQSQNPIVMGSMAVYTKVTSESNTARAIREMKKLMPGFDVFELERDARGIFRQVYNAFLEGDLEFIQKTCGESALVYFKTLLKKREVDGVYPKYDFIWDESERADFIGGRIPESNLPCFSFSIQIQEIYCNIDKKTNKIKDGAEDRILQNRFNFVLTLHENPDLEASGHPWEVIEVLPVEAVQMLA